MQRAAAAGVAQMVVTGSSEESTRKAIELARAHPGVLFATAGVHPHHAADLTAEPCPRCRRWRAMPDVVAVGECGLDYFRDFSPRDLQRRAFGWQLELAAATGKPVFLHQRDAHDDFLAILREHRRHDAAWRIASPRARRSATPISSSACTSASPAGSTTNGAACTCARWSREFRPDRLLIETDAPYLLPRDIKPAPKSRRNEPAYLPLRGARGRGGARRNRGGRRGRQHRHRANTLRAASPVGVRRLRRACVPALRNLGRHVRPGSRRYRAGGTAKRRLNARLNAASDS